MVNAATSLVTRRGTIGSARSRTALVVSAEEQVRADWSRYFERLGLRTLRCVGPQATCPLLAHTGADARCALHEQADVAIYQDSVVTPLLMLKLIRSPRTLPIAFAKDRVSETGQHAPVITSLASDAHTSGCIGLPPDQMGR